MWVFTRQGFFSVVRDRTRPTFRWVRTRDRAHLELLKRQFKLKAKIVDTPDADYPFRILLHRQVFEAIFSTLAENINYPNFKGSVAEPRYSKGLRWTWMAMKENYE